MRIIDPGRKDYYDIGMGLGHDDSIVYVREPKELPYEKYSRYRHPQFQRIYVGFCGKIYPACVMHDLKPENPTQTVCYTIEEIDKFVHSHFDKKDIEVYTDDRRKIYYRERWHWYDTPIKRKVLVQEIEKIKNKPYPSFTKLFTDHNTPIFVIDPPGEKIHINCLLKTWEFYKVFDSYTAFQEISMYVGGILLAPVPNIPNVPDETRIQAHGFDKYSFRKDKS